MLTFEQRVSMADVEAERGLTKKSTAKGKVSEANDQKIGVRGR